MEEKFTAVAMMFGILYFFFLFFTDVKRYQKQGCYLLPSYFVMNQSFLTYNEFKMIFRNKNVLRDEITKREFLKFVISDCFHFNRQR